MDRGAVRMLERLAAPQTLALAFASVERGGGMAGPDGEGVEQFAANLDANLSELRQGLLDGQWRPSPALRIRRRADPDRPLVVPAVRDRVVQRALADLLAPRVELELHTAAHAYRPRRSPHTAVAMLKTAIDTGLYQWVARGDVAKFFDRIDRGKLMAQLGRLVVDTRILEIIQKLLGAGVLDGVRVLDPEVGIAQGSPLSPLLSNLYLSGFDQAMAALPDCSFVRYSDDFCLLTSTESAAQSALEAAAAQLDELALALRPDKCSVGALAAGFEFVGFALGPSAVAPPLRALDSLAARLRSCDEAAGKRAWQGFAAFYGQPQMWAPALVERLAAQGDSHWSSQAQQWSSAAQTEILSPIEDSETDLMARDHARREARRFARSLTEEQVALFLQCFGGREGCHGVERIDERGQRRFVRRQAPLTAELVLRHVGAHETLASLCFRVDGLVRWLCIDIDVCRASLLPGGEPLADALLACHADALNVARALGELGAHPLVEDSGQKGRHVWVRFERPVPAKLALLLAFAAEDVAGEPPEQVRREHFPDREVLSYGKEGPLVKLPWGLHGKSGRRCLLFDQDGALAADQVAVLQAWRPTPVAVLQQPSLRTQMRDREAPDCEPQAEPPAKINLSVLPMASRVFQGCAVLGHIAAKAEATRYLDHRERLLVLMALGHLGQEGAPAIHAVMATTSNYHPQTTDKYIKSLAPSPISCARIRERYPELTRLVPCDCAFRLTQGAYPTPLLHAMKPAQIGAMRGDPADRPAATPGRTSPPPGARAGEGPRPRPAVQEASPPVVCASPPAAPAPAAPAPPRPPPEAAADPALATLHRWLRLRKEIAMLDQALALHFGEGDRIACALGTLVRERRGDSWSYRIDVGLPGEGEP
jgi:group II intron reverse transcriptase/maturase